METAENTSIAAQELEPDGNLEVVPEFAAKKQPVLIEPDLEFIKTIGRQAGSTYKKCFQCGTCSATCPISPETDSFPRKEMAWAAWGMKDRLLKDPDVWLCHQCNDCSTRCPRSGRPGDVMAAVRRESILEYSAPQFLARWVNNPRYLPALLAVPAILLGTAIYGREPIGEWLGFSTSTSGKIVYAYSSMIPQWLIMSFFALFGLLTLIAMVVGISRFWKGLKSGLEQKGQKEPVNSIFSSIFTVIKSILMHDNLAECTAARPRLISHVAFVFGFIALSIVTIWVMTARVNPLISSEFVYPFNFWNPWRVLANLGGLAMLIGCVWMIKDRLEEHDGAGKSTYFDWAFLGALSLVLLTGFITEIMHYLRLVPHRHVIYFVHLVFVFALLIYLPYSKFAHMIYRTTAMVFAETMGRKWGAKH